MMIGNGCVNYYPQEFHLLPKMIRSAYYKFRSKKTFSPYFYNKQDFLEIFRKKTSLFFLFFAILIVFYVLSNSFSLFGKRIVYSSDDPRNISLIGPKERVIVENDDTQVLQKQIKDLAYFSLKMPQKFDRANVKITFKNNSNSQVLDLFLQNLCGGR